jgi:3-oxoacyl-[acyl-carrier protein] reductase
MRLANKTALVTGAGRGIGRAIAAALAREGARVAIHYGSSESQARALAEEIAAAGGSAFLVHADLGSVKSIEAMFARFDADADGLDILVNNAGISATLSLAKTSEADFDRIFAVTAKAPFFVTQHALARLRDGGRIINVSSMAAHRARPHLIAYASSKAAMDALARSLAVELGPRRITVNNIAPGFIETDINADLVRDPVRGPILKSRSVLGRVGQGEDVARVAVFLASDEGAWITGQTVFANGGQELGG